MQGPEDKKSILAAHRFSWCEVLLHGSMEPSANSLMPSTSGTGEVDRSSASGHRRVKVRWVTPLGDETVSML